MRLPRLSGSTALMIAGVAIAALAAVLVFDQYLGREKAVAINIRHIEQNDRMFAEHVGRSLDVIDILLDEMRIAIREGGGWQQWSTSTGHQLLKARLSRALPQVRHLIIFDAEGNQRHTSFAESPPRINVRDRPYFVALEKGSERARYGPYVGRNSNRPTYALARRLGTTRFEGALMVAIEPDYFEEFCRSSRPHSEFEAAIVNGDGRIIAGCRSLAGTGGGPTANAGDDFRQVMANGEFAQAALNMNRSLIQGARFVLTTEPVPGHPDLRVVSATPRDFLIRDWRQQSIRTVLLASLALLTLLAAGLLIRRHLRQYAALAAELKLSHETLEQRIEIATRELEKRRNDALRVADAKSRFFAAASHDLRQPLHALQLFLSDLSRLTQDPEQRVLVDRIESATRSIADQLRSLLDISRLDMANITPERRQVSLPDLFAQLSSTYASAAANAHVRLLFRPRKAVLESDPALLSRLLGNLIDNAIKFSPNGTVVVCARWRAKAVRLEVRDNGRGIAPEHQSEIFDEFFQIENRARDPNAGLGLGLAIAHRIARLLGSGISLRSAVGRGSTFSLSLPCATGTGAAQPEGAGMPPLILVATGNAEDCDRFSERATRWGYRVLKADNLSAAWRLLDGEPGIPVILHTGSCLLSGECQSLLRRHPGVVITEAGCEMPELGAYQLREPIKPARLRALLRSLH
jgi:signal transduction histidine kinase